MIVERIPELALDARTDAEIAALLDTCYRGTFNRRSFYMQRHHLRLVCRDAGGIAGHLAMGFRAIRVGERLVDAATVAEVATAPERRGKGIATRLLAAGIAEAQGSTASFMLLFGVSGIYARTGFQPARNPLTHVDMRGARTSGVIAAASKHLMVLRLGDRIWDADAPVDLLGAVF